ncbi:MAG: secretin N-terminal domain-containing protein, partial [Planctomycetota bacterium]
YIERGNFIYVYTLEEIATIEQAARQREGRVIKLNYMTAVDAAAFVAPMLSEGGTITTNGRTEDFNIPDDAPVGADEYVHDNTLFVFDFPDRIDEIQSLVAQLDTRPQQVLVEATILQSELNEANAFGVDFSLIADLNFVDFVSPLSAGSGLISGGADDDQGLAFTSNAGATSTGPATFRGGVIAEDFAVFVRMLDSVADTTILSNPKILSLNRQPSRVLVGRKVGYLSTTATETASTQTVEFLDTGTQLYFRPFVTNDGYIRMELKPQVSEAVIREVTDSTGIAVTIPDEITNELVTNVMVRDGQTVVLGGLFREATKSSRSQVPIVGDLPIIGSAFRGHDDETERSEIIFMISPSIVSDPVLADQGATATDYVDDIVAGARSGVLPWGRSRQSQQLLVEAERLAETGDRERALHKVRRSLELYPNQPNAHRLQQELLGKDAIWPSRSILESIYNDETGQRRSRLRQSEPARLISPFSGGAMTDAKPIYEAPAPVASPTPAPQARPTFATGGAGEVDGYQPTTTNPFIEQPTSGPFAGSSTQQVPAFDAENHASNIDPLFEQGGVESWPAPATASATDSNVETIEHNPHTFVPTDTTRYDSSVNSAYIEHRAWNHVPANQPPVWNETPTQSPSAFQQHNTPAPFVEQQTPEAQVDTPSETVTNVEPESISAAPTSGVNNSFIQQDYLTDNEWRAMQGGVGTQHSDAFATKQPIQHAPSFNEVEGMAPPPASNTQVVNGTVVNNAFITTVSDEELAAKAAETRSMIRFYEGWDDFASEEADEASAESETSITDASDDTDN